jgi:hypothetical protein
MLSPAGIPDWPTWTHSKKQPNGDRCDSDTT